MHESIRGAAHYQCMQGRMRVPVVGNCYGNKASCNLCWKEAMHAQCIGSKLTMLEYASALHASLVKGTTIWCPLAERKQ